MIRSMQFGAVTALTFVAALAMGQQAVKVIVDGSPVRLRGQQPVVRDDRVLVPLRGILERMGVAVTWNPLNQTVSARGQETNVHLGIGQRTAAVNGRPVELDVPAQLIHGTTMVPLRFMAESVGGRVQWSALTQTVQIFTGGADVVSVELAPDGGRAQELTRPSSPNAASAIGPVTIYSGTVIPVRLQTNLSSDRSVQGDRFTAEVTASSSGLPVGTPIEGFVAGVRPQTAHEPGILELRFDRIDLPDGRTFHIDGCLISLSPIQVEDRGGVLTASDRDVQRGAIAGVGTSPGTFIEVMGTQPITQSSIRALLGYNYDLNGNQVHNVTLDTTNRFGVKLNSEVGIH